MSHPYAKLLSVVLPAITLLPAQLASQSLEGRLSDAPDGRVSFQFAAKKGVWGCSDGSIWMNGDRVHWRGGSRRGEPDECGPGPVRVTLRKQDGRVVDVDARVGPEGAAEGRRAGVELGTVSVREAAAYLLGLAGRQQGDVAEDAIFPAMLADSVEVWPHLLELARNRERPEDLRQEALFWVGQAAAEAATAGLGDVASDDTEDDQVREAAIFALSQRPADEGIPILMELVRTEANRTVRRSALFWLAESDDPRVLPFFEEILRGGLRE